jgi:type VI secretion system secreted protein VgrG
MTSLLPSVPDPRTLLSKLLSQKARLIELSFDDAAFGAGLGLLVERFTGTESLNALFEFHIDCISAAAHLPLKGLIGEPVALRVLQSGSSDARLGLASSYRTWHGLVTAAAELGSDGGLARYRLTLQPWFALLGLRRDSHVFQDKTALDIVCEVFTDYAATRQSGSHAAPFSLDVSPEAQAGLPKRSVCTQYRETDLAFVQRLLAEEGLSFRFEHTPVKDKTPAKHTLVIFDAAAKLPALAYGALKQDTIRFGTTTAARPDDTITAFSAHQQLQTNAVSVSSWDYKALVAPSAATSSTLPVNSSGAVPTLERYRGAGAYAYTNAGHADAAASRQLAANDAATLRYSGASSVRAAGMAPGYTFTLAEHEGYNAEQAHFTLLSLAHYAANNLGAQAAQLLGQADIEQGSYRNRFVAQPSRAAVLPDSLIDQVSRKPTVWGAQTALVVGTQNSDADGSSNVVTTDRDHRVKVQFPWQRGEQPLSGGLNAAVELTGGADPKGNAPGNEQSGTWVRVAELQAGPNWGSHFTPRIGDEVLVEFIEGDIDRPVIVASLHNGQDLPPFSAGVDSSANHPGVLSGWHSHNHEAGFNQWVMDDAPGQLRMRLASSTASSQLNLGYLIAQSPSSATRGLYRGSGFELRSDAWVTVRAKQGVLITTTARHHQGHGTGVTSTQMDVAEATAQLKGAEATAKALSEAALAQHALPLGANPAQQQFTAQIDVKAKGSFAANGVAMLGGQQTKKASAGSRKLSDSEPVEQFATPLVLIDSASTINLATPADTALFAGANLHTTVQGDHHHTAAYTHSSVSGAATSYFTHSGGIQGIAANGPLSLQAHTDALEILADKDVTVVSVNDSIEVLASQKVTLQAGQTSITLDGANITFACPGKFSVKGSAHDFLSGGSDAAALGRLPDSRVNVERYDEQFQLKDKDTGLVIANAPYRILDSTGAWHQGITDAQGNTERIHTEGKITFRRVDLIKG